jgi:hypothetical protein
MMSDKTNLPKPSFTDSAERTRLFFDNFDQQPLEFNAVEVDAAIAFFQGQGFQDDAALITAATVLKQAKLDEIPVKQLLDTLGDLDGFKLSALIGEILNNNRSPISTLGYRDVRPDDNEITRNISP